MLGWFLVAAAVAALREGTASSEEEYCNQHGCNYEDIYERRRFNEDDEIGDDFVCLADDDE